MIITLLHISFFDNWTQLRITVEVEYRTFDAKIGLIIFFILTFEIHCPVFEMHFDYLRLFIVILLLFLLQISELITVYLARRI